MRILALLIALGGLARAQFFSQAKKDYPASLLERPLLLAPLMIQAAAGVGLTHYGADAGGTGTTFSLGLDLGITPRLQMGLFIASEIDPGPSWGTLLLSAQVRLHRSVALRIDLGAEQLPHSGGSPGFLFGLGLPLKLQLHRMVALVSGSTSALGFGTQPVLVLGTASQYGYFLFSNDIFSMFVFKGPTGAAEMGALMLPLGLLFQPHARIALGVRSGYRLVFANAVSVRPTNLYHFIPLSFDVAVNIVRSLDVGFTAFIAGSIDDNGSPLGPTGYAAIRQFDFQLAGRF